MLDLILSWASEIIADSLSMVISLILPVFGFTFDSFARAFPFAATAYSIFQRVALAGTLLITVCHMIPFLLVWFGIRTNELKSTPLRQMYQCVLAVVMIYYGNYILNGIINICQYPFNALLYAENDPSWNLLQFDIGIIISALTDLFSAVSPLLYLILLLLIGFNLIKVLLEAVERYVVLFVIIYLSPLFACALASQETSGIYKRFFTMFMSQCLLLLLNVWTIKMAISMFSSLGANNIPILGLLMGYSFLRIALRMDSYLNQLGLNAAVTGAGLGMELVATGATMLGGLRGITGMGAAAGGGSVTGSPVLGLSKSIGNAVRYVSPAAMAGEYAGATYRGLRSTASGAAASTVQAFRGGSGVGNAVGTGIRTARDTVGDNVSTNASGVDNIISRHIFAGRTGAAVSDFASGNNVNMEGSLYNSNQKLVANNAHSAGKVMAAFHEEGHQTQDPKTVAAVLEGIGARNASPALKNFINVGNGSDESIKAGSSSFKLDKSGIHASYVKNGTRESLELHTAAQYNALNANEQKTYQQFASKSGDTYYYKTSSEKAVSARGRNTKPKSDT